MVTTKKVTNIFSKRKKKLKWFKVNIYLTQKRQY